MAAYTTQDYVDLISQYKDTQPELAFAIYNGVSGMGGGMPTDYQGGALDLALRNAWGPENAKNWVNHSDSAYGNAMFDPKTGQYGYYKNGAISSGTLGNYTGANFDPNAIKVGGIQTYDPTKAASNLPVPAPNPAAPVPKIAATQPTTGGSTLASMSRTTNPGSVTPLGVSNVPNVSHGPLTNTTDPLQVPTGTTRGAPTATDPTVTPPGTTPSVTTPPGTTTPPPPAITPPPPGAVPPPTTTPPATTTPPGNTGNTGDFPNASAAPWQVPKDASKPFDFYNDEGYQFRKQQGMDKIQNSAAARGGLASGATLKDLATFNSGLASEEYDKAYGRYDTSRKFAEANAVDERNYNNTNREWDTTFNNSNRIDARNFDWAQTKDARDFAVNLAKWNTEFGYNADHAQQKEQMDTLLQMAKMGLLSETQMGDLSKYLTTQISNNNLTGAGANANATVGGANDLNSLLGKMSTYFNSLTLTPH